MLLLFAAGTSKLRVSTTTVNFIDPASASQQITVSGGTSPYYISTLPNTNIATATTTAYSTMLLALGAFSSGPTSTFVTVSPVSAGTTTFVISDSSSPTQTITVTVVVGPALTVSPSSLTLNPNNAIGNQVGILSIAQGRVPYTAISSNPAIATASLLGNSVTVTGIAVGNCNITITDTDNEQVVVPVTVQNVPGRVLNFSVETTQHTYGMMPNPIFAVISSGGGISLSPAGGTGGQISTPNIAGLSITDPQIAPTSVAGIMLIQTKVSTNQANIINGPTNDWTDSSNNIIAPGTTLTNGASYYWNVGPAGYTGSADPYQTTYTLPASGSARFVFQHNPFITGCVGAYRIFFQGSVQGSITQANLTSSGSSTCSDGGNGVWDPFRQIYRPPYSFPHTNGAIVYQSVSTSQNVNGTYPLSYQFTAVNTPSSSDGSSSLQLTLTDPAGILVATWSNITTTGTYTYTGTNGNSANAAGSWKWGVQAIDHNNDQVGDIPYSDTFVCTWTASLTYWTGAPASGTYIYASDGSTTRSFAADSNVLLQWETPGEIAVTVYNGNSSSAVSFSIGMDIAGI